MVTKVLRPQRDRACRTLKDLQETEDLTGRAGFEVLMFYFTVRN